MFQLLGLLNSDGTVLERNQTALNFIGLEQAQVVGKPFWELPGWNRSAALQQQLMAATAQASEGEFILRQTIAEINPDGTLKGYSGTIDALLNRI